MDPRLPAPQVRIIANTRRTLAFADAPHKPVYSPGADGTSPATVLEDRTPLPAGADRSTAPKLERIVLYSYPYRCGPVAAHGPAQPNAVALSRLGSYVRVSAASAAGLCPWGLGLA
jgi:hypothetical protein